MQSTSTDFALSISSAASSAAGRALRADLPSSVVAAPVSASVRHRSREFVRVGVTCATTRTIVSPRFDVIKKLGKVSLGLRGLKFAHASPISLVDSTSGFLQRRRKGRVIRMFSRVDPVPGLVVPGHPLDTRRWRRDGVGQGLGPARIKRVCQSRSPPKFERDRQGVDAGTRPPGGFIPKAMQFAVMEPADGDRDVADLAPRRTRLSEPKVMGFRRRPAADHAGLRSDVFAVLLVAQADGFRRNATPPRASVIIRDNRLRDCDCIFSLGNKRLLDWRSGFLCRRRLGFFFKGNRRRFDRLESFPEAGFDRVGVGGDQRVLGSQVLVDPVGGFITGLELTEVCKQLFPQRR
jgi:hypothetical protein